VTKNKHLEKLRKLLDESAPIESEDDVSEFLDTLDVYASILIKGFKTRSWRGEVVFLKDLLPLLASRFSLGPKEKAAVTMIVEAIETMEDTITEYFGATVFEGELVEAETSRETIVEGLGHFLDAIARKQTGS
jgi:hypothetical protein